MLDGLWVLLVLMNEYVLAWMFYWIKVENWPFLTLAFYIPFSCCARVSMSMGKTKLRIDHDHHGAVG